MARAEEMFTGRLNRTLDELKATPEQRAQLRQKLEEGCQRDGDGVTPPLTP